MTTQEQREILDNLFPGYRESSTNAAQYKLVTHFRRRPEYHESGEIIHMEFSTRTFLSFAEMTCLLAKYCVDYNQPLPANKYELFDICQAMIIEFGRFKGIDYDVINSSTLYKCKVTVAKCLPEYFPKQQIPQWVVVPPPEFDEALVQVGKPKLNEHMIVCMNLYYGAGKTRIHPCNNTSDYKTIRITDGVTVYQCEGHYRHDKRKGLVMEGKRISQDVTMVEKVSHRQKKEAIL